MEENVEFCGFYFYMIVTLIIIKMNRDIYKLKMKFRNWKIFNRPALTKQLRNKNKQLC